MGIFALETEPGTENNYLFPAQALPKTSTEGFWIRFAGRLIDWVGLMLCSLIAGVVAAIACAILEGIGSMRPGWIERIQNLDSIASFFWGLVAAVLLSVAMERLTGATFGKWMLGLRVVNRHLRPPSLKAALIRNATYLFDTLLFGAPAWGAMSGSELNERQGDVWAETVVAKKKALPEPAYYGTGRLVMGLAASAAFVVALQALILTMRVF